MHCGNKLIRGATARCIRGTAVTWICITAICLIAAIHGYGFSISPSDGLRFSRCYTAPSNVAAIH